MNIQLLTPRFNTYYQQNSYNNSVMNIKLNTLNADTVSFGVGEKKLDSKKPRTINVDLAKKVIEEAREDAQELKFVLHKYLDPLVATAKNPNNPICAGERGIQVRIKSENSLREKVTPRDIRTKFGVKNVGDLIGARIVLRDSNPKAVDKVLIALAEAAKQGALQITEIEKYNPKNGKIPVENIKELGYGTKAGRLALEKAAGIEASVGPKDSGYPAIHITIKTKHGCKAEIQIMGVDVEDLKHVEDLGYKIRCGKGVCEKYEALEPELLPAFEELEEQELEDAYMQYVSDAYLTAFCAPPQKYNTRKKPKFLQIPYYLPADLDFNHIAKRMQEVSNS